MSTSTTIIDTIHGPGLPGHITVAGGSTEPWDQVFMVVEDDDDIVDEGRAQGFTTIIEPKRERTDPPSILPHASRGCRVGGGASVGRPPRGGGHGCMTTPPVVEDLSAEEDDDNDFTGDPCDEEEDKVQFNYPDKVDDDNEHEEDDKDGDDNYEKVDIIKL